MASTTKNKTVTLTSEGKVDISDNARITGPNGCDLESILAINLKEFDKKNVKLTIKLEVEQL